MALARLTRLTPLTAILLSLFSERKERRVENNNMRMAVSAVSAVSHRTTVPRRMCIAPYSVDGQIAEMIKDGAADWQPRDYHSLIATEQ
jgi:hypothetical protein